MPSDFPRGWTLTDTDVTSGTATIIRNANAGVTQTLDSLYAHWSSSTAGGATLNNSISVVVDGASIMSPTMFIVTPGDTEITLTDLNIPASPGGTLEVTFNFAPGAGQIEDLVISGHDN